jgi:hypothetical protein
MKAFLIIVSLVLTGCATHQGTDGRTYYWIAPLPSGEGSAWSPSAQVNTYQGTVNGRGYTVQTYGRGR